MAHNPAPGPPALGRLLLAFLPVGFALAIVGALIYASRVLIEPAGPVAEVAASRAAGELLTAEELTTRFAFPSEIDPREHYLFYIHGRIIEDQGLPAVSELYGEYQYAAILEALAARGFRVIAEQRSTDADAIEYGERFAAQVEELLAAGVPGANLTVVGASKGAFIASWVSHRVSDPEVRYVLLAGCHPNTVDFMLESEVTLHGRVLAMRDFEDTVSAGSCARAFTLSQAYGLTEGHEIVLDVGNGHGLIYAPLDAWVTPTVEWARRRPP